MFKSVVARFFQVEDRVKALEAEKGEILTTTNWHTSSANKMESPENPSKTRITKSSSTIASVAAI